jgi:hypothetical protein
MRKAVLAAAGLVILAAVSWTAAPAQAIGARGTGTIGRTGPIGVATATTLPGRGFTPAQGSTGTNRRTGPGAAREMRKHLARAG